MELHHHGVSDLFYQLGLDGTEKGIDLFINMYGLRHEDGELYRAIFWSPQQARFIKDAIAEDAEWAEAVDELDARLRR